MKQLFSLQSRIFIFISVLLLFALGIEIITFNKQIEQHIVNEGKKQTLTIADTVSRDPRIIAAFSDGTPSTVIQPITKNLQEMTGVSFIVVMNMDSIRYSHPEQDRIGKHFVGGDEQEAINGKRYTSIAKGTLGISLRSFVPIISDGQQIGVVSVGKLLTDIKKQQQKYTAVLNLLTFCTLIIGLIGAIFLAKNIKRTIFGLEPYEIAALMEERDILLSSINEGIVAIDKECTIIEFNENAKRLLSLNDDCVGKPLQELFPETRLPEIMGSGIPLLDQEETINGKIVLCSRTPMVSRGETIGAVASYRDMSEIRKLAEELTEVKSYINALRAQHHEHLNKLHVISGLIQLHRFKEASSYITATMTKQQELFDFLRHNICSPAISGLLLAKIKEAEENHIECTIDPESSFPSIDKSKVDSFVIIIGNLIQNAIDALKTDTSYTKNISILLRHQPRNILIRISDTGPGIPSEYHDLIFTNGFTTKEESGNRGYGLYLLKQHVSKLEGSIEIENSRGTTFTVNIPAL
jgi:sensor histidine kinase regulating citrate/malate metabolism